MNNERIKDIMQFQIEQPDLLTAIERTNGGVDKKNTIPVLSNILFDIDAATQRVRVTATNLEIGMQTVAPCQTVESFSITIPAQKLFEIVRELPAAPITMKVDDKNWIHLECLKSNFKLAGLPKNDFPSLPSLDDFQQVSLSTPGTLFRDIVGHVSFAVSHDESRYALTGVLFEFAEDTVTAVATDGHRLAKVTRAVTCMLAPDQPESARHVILPLKAVTEMKKLCTSANATFAVTQNNAIFQTGDTVLVTRRIEAQFPDYKQIIPQATEQTVPVDRDALLQALRRVALLTSGTRLIRFEFKPGVLVLRASDPNTGEASDILPVGDATTLLEIGFNARYIMDGLSVLDGQPSFGLLDALAPGLMTGDGDADAGFVYVIMPMRM